VEEEVHILGATLLVLEVCHTIDVMHLTKNLYVNLLGFMVVYGKPKDSLEAQQDLQKMKEQGNLLLTIDMYSF